MRKLFAVVFLFLSALYCHAQGGIIHGNGDPRTQNPVPNCANSRFYIDDSTALMYTAAQGSPCVWTAGGDATLAALPTAPTVYYRFNETSGASINDYSGNGYNATLGTAGRAPTRVASGTQFLQGQGADMPSVAAINNAKTICWYGNFMPLGQAAANNSGFSSILSSNDGGTNGVSYDIQYTGTLNNGQYGTTVFGLASFNTFVNNAGVTAIDKAFGGMQSICIVLGKTGTTVTTDQVYINGALVDKYFRQGATGNTTNATFYTIGATASGNWTAGMNTIMYEQAMFSDQYTAAQIAAVHAAFLGDLNRRGIPTRPVQPTLSQAQLIHVGDSLTVCLNVPSTNCWADNGNLTSLLTNQPTYNVSKYAITGITAFAIGAAEPWRVGQLCNTNQGPGVVTLWADTNDIGSWQSSITASQHVGIIANAVTQLHNAGCKVFFATIISRCGNTNSLTCSASGTFEAARATTNNLFRQQLKTTIGADGIVDLAANPHIGKTNQYNGGSGGGTCSGATTYFQSDCVHLTVTAQPDVDAAMANSLNYYFGNTAANPAVITTTSTLTSAQRFVDATGGAVITLTLPDGVGPSGESYCITTGAGVVSVQGQTLYGAAQNVNGSGSAVALPTNATTCLKIIPLAQATAGVQWVF